MHEKLLNLTQKLKCFETGEKMKNKITQGFGGGNKAVSGEVIEWSDEFLDDHTVVTHNIVYNRGHIPLYRAAFLADHGVKAVLMEKGGKNYHPLILLTDAHVCAVAGIGSVNLCGKTVTVDSGEGIIYEGEILITKEKETEPLETTINVYTNVGYPTAIEKAAKTADGIGILRTEFTAVRTLSRILTKKFQNTTVKEAIHQSNEADVIYAIAKNEDLKEYLKNDLKQTIKNAVAYFGQKEIIVRTFDIPRRINEPMGNRGIRRCIAEGGGTIQLIAEAVKEVLRENPANIGVILPLVSHYSQITHALDIIMDTGLSLRKDKNALAINYGWEIEQPAASQNNELWLTAFTKEYGCPPHFIAIGTNDLTQFTMALGRDVYAAEKSEKVRKYLRTLYNESDFSVVRQIYEVSKQCSQFGTRVFLVGQAAADPHYAQLMFSFGITPSVAVDSVNSVKALAHEFEKEKTPEKIVKDYIKATCDKYPPKVRPYVRSTLLGLFGME